MIGDQKTSPHHHHQKTEAESESALYHHPMREVQMKTISYTSSLPVTTTSSELLPVEIYNLEKVSPHPHIQNLLEYSYQKQEKKWRVMLEWDSHWEPLTNLATAATPVLDEDDIRDITRQLLSVIVHCLERGVDHRDISVGNIYLNRDTNQIKLANFQHSTALSVLPHTLQSPSSSLSSTPPELYRQGSYTPHQAAVWSVGCLIFHLLSRAAPLRCRADVATNNVRWEVFRPQSVSGDVYDLVLMCLNPKPENRLSLDKLVRHPWVVNETLV